MINYEQYISQSGLSIYDTISPYNQDLFIPNGALEEILSNYLVGLSLNGLALRTRSKVVKQEICRALGYPIPRSFMKTQPRFPGQNFDVYTQKSLNVQIWNEEVDYNRRYVFLRVNEDDIITRVKVITGNELVQYDRTGTLTTKYQATMQSFGQNHLFSTTDSENVSRWIIDSNNSLNGINPNETPDQFHLLPIDKVFKRLLPMVGKTISYIGAIQERNRGAELHSMICSHLGYSVFHDDGSYPDIANQLIEIKLQTSPTIDLGLHSPEDGAAVINGKDYTTFYSSDIRYVIFDGEVYGNRILLKNLYAVAGCDFTEFFPLFKGKGQNAKIQLPLPINFFD
ncbi:MAG: hypothetical protein RR531_11050 [Longicatena sp.]